MEPDRQRKRRCLSFKTNNDMSKQDIQDMSWAGFQTWEIEEILVQGYRYSREDAAELIHDSLNF